MNALAVAYTQCHLRCRRDARCATVEMRILVKRGR
jgi:hypothetical protein